MTASDQGQRVNFQLYLCDLPADCADDDLIGLLQAHGEITTIEWQPAHEGSDLRRALVNLESDRPVLAVVGQLNRESLGEQRIVASPALPSEECALSKRQLSVSTHIAVQLEEKFKWPRMMIRQTVGLCGVRFAVEMMRRALAIDAADGMLVPDGSRRRTVGGIFFALTRQYVTPDVGRAIFYRTREAVKEQKASARQAAAQTAPDAPPRDEATPVEPVPEPEPAPAPDPEALNAAREQLTALREAMQAAQSELDAMKRGQAARTTGVFSLAKQMVDAQKAIDALLSAHPELG